MYIFGNHNPQLSLYYNGLTMLEYLLMAFDLVEESNFMYQKDY